jgi:hypothetical protein
VFCPENGIPAGAAFYCTYTLMQSSIKPKFLLLSNLVKSTQRAQTLNSVSNK